MVPPRIGLRFFRQCAAAALVVCCALVCLEPMGCGGGNDYECTGSSPCWERSSDFCVQQDGCSVGPRCIKTACLALATQAECNAEPGLTCYWTDADGGCKPAADACGNRSYDNCLLGSGCGWGEGCTGTERPCFENKTAQECGTHFGCAWRLVPNL